MLENLFEYIENQQITELTDLYNENPKAFTKAINGKNGKYFMESLAYGMSEEILKLLIDYGVNLKITDSKGFNLLAYNYDIPTAKLLIDNGVDVYHLSNNGYNITYFLKQDILNTRIELGVSRFFGVLFVDKEKIKLIYQYYNELIGLDQVSEYLNPDYDKFWNLIEESYVKGKGDEWKQSRELVKILEEQHLDEIFQFQITYNKLVKQIYNPEIFSIFYYINGGSSKNGFSDKFSSIISLGKESYDKLQADYQIIPELLKKNQKRLLNNDNFECFGIENVSKTTYFKKTAFEDFNLVLRRIITSPGAPLEFDNAKMEELIKNKANFIKKFPKLKKITKNI